MPAAQFECLTSDHVMYYLDATRTADAACAMSFATGSGRDT